MIKSIARSLSFMTLRERYHWFFLTGLKSMLALLDLVGILAIGFLVTSTAIFLTEGSDQNRTLEFVGFEFQAVNSQNLPWIAGMLLVLFLSKAFFSVLLTKSAAFFVAKIEARAAKTIAEISFGGDLGDARNRSREEMMYAIQAGSPAAFNTILNALNVLVSEAMLFIIICSGFLFIDAWATFGAVLYFGLVAFIIQYFVGSLTTRASEIQAQSSVLANRAISDLLSVFRELLVLGKRQKYIDNIYRARVSAADSSATTYYLSGMPRYIIEAALLVGVALFIVAQVFSGDFVKSAGTIGTFLAGGFRLTAALLPLQNSVLSITAAIPTASRAHDILSQEIVIKKTGQFTVDTLSTNATPDPITVKFEKVSFIYPGASAPALSQVSFEIEPGSQVALMGPSGAGKSTIADLLCLVLTPSSGKITRIGTAATGERGSSNVRVSYVPQKPGLVSGTIAENVALAVNLEDIDRAQVIEAMKLAHLTDLLEALPQGIDTNLGKLQDGLSGGQMQRLGLARALYSKPGLLVMDEATSALDAESESEIQRALHDMRGKVTVVLIAHRLNTIQHADNVFLIENGTLKDSGKFKELVGRNPAVERVVDLMRVEKT